MKRYHQQCFSYTIWFNSCQTDQHCARLYSGQGKMFEAALLLSRMYTTEAAQH